MDFGAEIRDIAAGGHEVHPFYMFEPWDVADRPEWFWKQAADDGIDIDIPDLRHHVGDAPHTFQTGYMKSTTFRTAVVAGTQIGKSYPTLIQIIIVLTGELPICFRYPVGVDTGVPRVIDKENIIRWGRRDKKTGKVIDHDPKKASAEAKTQGKEWDCGNICGVGPYPEEKIAPPNSEVWIGSFKKAIQEFWWPRLTSQKRCLIPPHLIDRDRGNNGFDQTNKRVYLTRGSHITCISYDATYKRFEAENVWMCCLDEEPDDKIFAAAQGHCEWLTISMTPYNGITYTKDIFFPKKKGSDSSVFHATQYDCPYRTADSVRKKRAGYPKWEIGARVYGLHTEATGKPYYDWEKINTWIRLYSKTYDLSQFVPGKEYIGMFSDDLGAGLMDVPIRKIPCEEENSRNVWRIYEDVKVGVPYVVCVDPAEGGETPDDAGDKAAALILRPPEGREERPVPVAALRSTLETAPFARTVAYAMRYYNNGLLVAETKRHAANALFAAELKTYPFWYKMVNVQDATGRAKTFNGFDTNRATRASVFDEITSWISDFDPHQDPGFNDEPLMVELAAAVVGKNGRCDHPRSGSLDSVLALGMGLYVFKNSPEQIQHNAWGGGREDSRMPFFIEHLTQPKYNKYLCGNMPNWR